MDSRQTDGALGLARAALAATPAGLLTDVDGTLAPIVDDPVAARALPEAVAALRALARNLAVVAVISGRAALDARRMLGEAGREVLIVGNHGLEWLEPGADAPSPDPARDATRAGIARALAVVPPLDGMTIEDKGLSATVHVRRAADPNGAHTAVLAALLPLVGTDSGLVIREGRMSIELRPAGAGDKGTAARAIVERYGLRGILVAGDDVTDLDLFRAAADLRDKGVRSAILAVGGGREVPAAVSDAADAVLPDPAAFAKLLTDLAALHA